MSQPKRVLYIHHTSELGGSTVSLLSTIQHLDPSRFTPLVCLTEAGEAEQLFATSGVGVRKCPTPVFEHTTSGWWPLYQPWSVVRLAQWLSQYRTACRNLESLAKWVSADIVHLNSLVLAPYASVFSRLKIPTIVHVREPVVDGTFGVRKRWLQQLLIKYPDAVIYICKDNRERLTGAHPKGQVIYEPVDFSKFDRNLDQATARRELGVPERARAVLFVGGLSAVKGVIPFLQAMQRVLTHVPDLYLLMPFASHTPSTVPSRVLLRWVANRLGVYSLAQRVDQMVDSSPLKGRVLRTNFRLDIEKFFAAVDVVLIPFVEPHFARPVVEAGAMAKPVVAFRIGGVEEVVADGETGLLVPPGDVDALAAGTIRLLQDRDLAVRMGETGYRQARRDFSAELHASQLMALYNRLAG